MIHDAIGERLTKEYVGIELLERDDDPICIIEQEMTVFHFVRPNNVKLVKPRVMNHQF